MLHDIKHSYSLHIGGLGSPIMPSAAFIASYSLPGWFNNEDVHLNCAIGHVATSRMYLP